MIKSAASAASRKSKSMWPRSREAPGRRLGKRTAAGRGASLDLGPLDLVFLEAALAADLITASKSFPKSSKRASQLSKPAFLDLGPLDLVFLEAALAADLITAPISLHVPLPPNPFLDPAV